MYRKNKKYISLSFFCGVVIIFCVTVPAFSRANPEHASSSHGIGILLPTQRERQWVQIRKNFIHADIVDTIPLRRFYSDMNSILQKE